MVEFPVPPDGFNVARENIPHGDLKVMEYDSKTPGTRRRLRVYTPPAIPLIANTRCSVCNTARQYGHRMDATRESADHRR